MRARKKVAYEIRIFQHGKDTGLSLRETYGKTEAQKLAKASDRAELEMFKHRLVKFKAVKY